MHFFQYVDDITTVHQSEQVIVFLNNIISAIIHLLYVYLFINMLTYVVINKSGLCSDSVSNYDLMGALTTIR